LSHYTKLGALIWFGMCFANILRRLSKEKHYGAVSVSDWFQGHFKYNDHANTLCTADQYQLACVVK
jgi:hypothetical protein